METRDSIYVQERTYCVKVKNYGRKEEVSFVTEIIVPWKFIIVYTQPQERIEIIRNPEILENMNIKLIKDSYPKNQIKLTKKSIRKLENIIDYFSECEREDEEVEKNFRQMLKFINGMSEVMSVSENREHTDIFKSFEFR